MAVAAAPGVAVGWTAAALAGVPPPRDHAGGGEGGFDEGRGGGDGGGD